MQNNLDVVHAFSSDFNLLDSHMSRPTRFNSSRKTETAVMHGLFLGTNTVYMSIRPSINLIVYFHHVKNVEIRVI